MHLLKKYLEEKLSQKINNISKSGEGENNNTFLIETSVSKYIAKQKKDNVNSNLLYNEYVILKYLEKEKINFCPKIISYDSSRNILITDYFPGKICLVKNMNKDKLDILLKNLSILHKLKYEKFMNFCNDNKFKIPVLNSTEKHFELVCTTPYNYIKKKCNDKEIYQWINEHYKYMKKEILKYKDELEFVHGDLRENLIEFDNNLFFIDWEFARFTNDYLTELADIIVYSDLPKETIDIFVNNYIEKTKLNHNNFIKKLSFALKFVSLGDVLWSANKYLTLKKIKNPNWTKYYNLTNKRILERNKYFDNFLN